MEILNSLVGSGLLSVEAAIFYAAGLLGMIAHYAKKRIKGQTKVSMSQYFGKNNPTSSMGAFATYAATMTGMVMGLDVSSLAVTIVVILGMTCGWTIDSGVNSVKES